MNKDEMIEQMAKDLVDEIEFDITFYDFNGSVGIHFDYDCTAKNVVEKGYRKVADDEIVIKKRKYEQLKKYNRDRKRLRLRWQQTKQETAREIIDKIENLADKEIKKDGNCEKYFDMVLDLLDKELE